jgi:predicted house-cleaning NTP pyrophosphatase (Maf/HAM1 superfamily)
MSDCLHCDIHEMLESHLQSEQADLAEIAAKVTEVLADLILTAAPDEQLMLMADVVANLGGMVLEKTQDGDPKNARRSSH